MIFTSVALPTKYTMDEMLRSTGLLQGGSLGTLVLRSATCGAPAAVLAVLAAQPVDTVRTRLYNSTGVYSGALDAFLKIVAAEGPFALWKGTAAHMARYAPHGTLCFVFIDLLQRQARKWKERALETEWNGRMGDAFDLIDTREPFGLLDRGEVLAAMRRMKPVDLGRRPTAERKAKIGPVRLTRRASDHAFEVADANGDGYVDKSEFSALASAMRRELYTSTVRAVFASLDADGNGRVTRKEFQAAVEALCADEADGGNGDGAYNDAEDERHAGENATRSDEQRAGVAARRRGAVDAFFESVGDPEGGVGFAEFAAWAARVEAGPSMLHMEKKDDALRRLLETSGAVGVSE